MAEHGTLYEARNIFSKKVGYDYLFELETWLKGMEAFFQIENLPLSPEERERATIRNYVDEISVAREGLLHLGKVAEKLLGEGKEDFASFIQYLERQIGHGALERRESRLASAELEISEAVEKIADYVRIFDELSRAKYISLPTYLSVGRVITGSLRDDPNLGVFFREDLLPVFDTVDKRTLARVMLRVSDRRAKRELATLFVGLFKGLHYADEAAAAIEKAVPRRRALILFSRIHQLGLTLSEYIRTSLLPAEPEGSARHDVLDRLLFSTEMEMRKILDGELVDVAHLRESRLAQERMENACGILRDLFEQNILALAEIYAGAMDSRRIFPDHLTRRQQSLRLRQDLWDLVVACRRFQDSPSKASWRDFVDKLSAFRRGSMRYLMFKDWSAFDRFEEGLSRDRSVRTVLAASHQFEVFVKTLIREVGKRQVLSDRPFDLKMLGEYS
jgi:hypothetical protein